MGTLIFDIETVGEKWEEIDTYTKQVLTRSLKKKSKTDQQERELVKDTQERLGLSPFTGAIVALGLYDVERAQGVVYFQSNEKNIEIEEGGFVLRSRSEKEMLEDFWEGALSYDTFVSYNGRCFDVPFMSVRSAVYGIRPTQDLMQHRYLERQKSVFHIDVQDQLSYYGALQRKPSLHIACRTFGIESPKREGEEGEDIARLFREGRFRKIARYNARDVASITKLYKRWRTYLAPSEFINRLEN